MELTQVQEPAAIPGLDSLVERSRNERQQWEMVKLGDVAPARSSKQEFLNDETVWDITLDQIESNTGKIINKKFSKVSDAPQSSNFVDEDNVLYSKLRPYLNKVIIPEEKGFATTELVPLYPDKKRLNKRFLLHFLRAPGFVSWATNTVAGAKMPRLTMSEFWKHQIPLPPLPEQQRIVARLDKAQQLIDQRKEQLKLMDALVQSLFYEMFGDPVKNEKGWDVKPLGQYVSFKHGYAFSSEFFSETGKSILLTPGNFYEKGGFQFRGEKQKYYTGSIPQEFILSEGDMLVAMTEQAPGLLGSPLFVPTTNVYLHNQRLGKVIFDKKFFDDLYLFHYFNQPYFRDEVQFTSTGTKVKHTSPTKLQAVQSILPPLPLQQTFADRVQQIEALKQSMTASLRELEQNFQALMQEAFGG